MLEKSTYWTGPEKAQPTSLGRLQGPSQGHRDCVPCVVCAAASGNYMCCGISSPGAAKLQYVALHQDIHAGVQNRSLVSVDTEFNQDFLLKPVLTSSYLENSLKVHARTTSKPCQAMSTVHPLWTTTRPKSSALTVFCLLRGLCLLPFCFQLCQVLGCKPESSASELKRVPQPEVARELELIGILSPGLS